MDKDSRIYIAGSTGMVGTAIVNKLKELGYNNLFFSDHKSFDLTDQIQCKWFFKDYKFDYVFMCAAKVGGIKANSDFPVEFFYENAMMNMNVIKYSAETGVKKTLLFGSNCMYPKKCKQPINENLLLTGIPEKTSMSYSMAKLAALKFAEAFNTQYNTSFMNVIPCCLYGDNDNFDLTSSHLIPALMKKIHIAKTTNQSSIELWGTGRPKREFMHVKDLADACIYLMNNVEYFNPINIGSGKDYSVLQLVNMMKKIIGWDGEILFDTSKPDGTYRKLLDSSLLNSFGWKPSITLKKGLKEVYKCKKNSLI